MGTYSDLVAQASACVFSYRSILGPNRHHRRQRTLLHAGFSHREAGRHRNALRRALRQLRSRRARRPRSRLPRAPLARPSHLALGTQLPRQHLRIQITRRATAFSPSAPSALSKKNTARSTSSSPISSSTARAAASPLFSAKASSRTSASPTRSARSSVVLPMRPAAPSAST